MAESENVDQGGGCNGCGGGCLENTDGRDASFGGETAPQALGAGIAHVAVTRMTVNGDSVAKRDDDVTCEITDEDIDGFIEECDRRGKNPLDVVKFVADENGIDLSGEAKIAYEGNKARIRNLLVEVLKRIVFGFVSYVSDKYGLGIIQAAVNALLKPKEGCSRSAKPADQAHGLRMVRIVPVHFGYAFTW